MLHQCEVILVGAAFAELTGKTVEAKELGSPVSCALVASAHDKHFGSTDVAKKKLRQAVVDIMKVCDSNVLKQKRAEVLPPEIISRASVVIGLEF